VPRGPYLDVANSTRRSGPVVGGSVGGDEACLDVERERLDGAGEHAVFAAGEGTDLGHDNLRLLFQARDHRGLMAIRSPGTPTRSRKARSTAQDG